MSSKKPLTYSVKDSLQVPKLATGRTPILQSLEELEHSMNSSKELALDIENHLDSLP